jgi:hypothetical protein
MRYFIISCLVSICLFVFCDRAFSVPTTPYAWAFCTVTPVPAYDAYLWRCWTRVELYNYFLARINSHGGYVVAWNMLDGVHYAWRNVDDRKPSLLSVIFSPSSADAYIWLEPDNDSTFITICSGSNEPYSSCGSPDHGVGGDEYDKEKAGRILGDYGSGAVIVSKSDGTDGELLDLANYMQANGQIGSGETITQCTTRVSGLSYNCTPVGSVVGGQYGWSWSCNEVSKLVCSGVDATSCGGSREWSTVGGCNPVRCSAAEILTECTTTVNNRSAANNSKVAEAAVDDKKVAKAVGDDAAKGGHAAGSGSGVNGTGAIGNQGLVGSIGNAVNGINGRVGPGPFPGPGTLTAGDIAKAISDKEKSDVDAVPSQSVPGTPTYDSNMVTPPKSSLTTAISGYLTNHPLLTLISGSRVTVAGGSCDSSVGLFGGSFAISMDSVSVSVFEAMGAALLIISGIISFWIIIGRAS